MNGQGIEAIVKFTIAGVITLGAISFIAKDGQQIGAFITATGDAFGKFAKSVQAT
jgi:hypothetical protein